MSLLIAYVIVLLKIILLWIIPGKLILGKQSQNWTINLGIWTVVGMVFTSVGLFFARLMFMETFFFVLILAIVVIYIFLNRHIASISNIRILVRGLADSVFRQDIFLLLLFIVGIILQISPLWSFGNTLSNGDAYFCCRSVPDMIYHSALTYELALRIPPHEPGMAGVEVTNYHYWSHLIHSVLWRGLPTTIFSYFAKIYTVVFAILLAISVYAITQISSLSRNASRWFVFLFYFFGDLTIFLISFTTHQLSLNLNMSDNAIQLLSGPPRAISILIGLWGIFLLIKWIQYRSWRIELVLVFLLSSLISIKVYTFLLFSFGLIGMSGYYLVKKNFSRLTLAFLTLMLSLLFFVLNNTTTTNGFNFHLPYNVYNFIEKPELGLSVLRLRLNVYEEYNNLPKILMYHLGFVGMYLVVMLGSLLSGLLYLPWCKQLSSELKIFLISASSIGIFMTLFSSQKAGGLNTTQFLLTLPYLLILPSAILFEQMQLRWKRLSVVMALGIVFLTASQVAVAAMQNFQILKGPGVGPEEVIFEKNFISLLSCLSKEQSNGLLFLDSGLIEPQKYISIPYITQKKVYLAGIGGILRDHGVDGYLDRKEKNDVISHTQSWQYAHQFFTENNIKYVLTDAANLDLISNATPSAVLCENNKWKIVELYETE